MPSFKDDFLEVVERVKRGRDLGSAGFDPVYYLVFNPRHILDVKRQTSAWLSKLSGDGWNPGAFSVSEHVADILGAPRTRRLWLAADKQSPTGFDSVNKALGNELGKGELIRRLEASISTLADANPPNAPRGGILIVTDLEGLHPYMRPGAIEGQLAGKFRVPTIFLYPGVSTGHTRLRFLGFYPEDGNYRSVHVGG